ncbi:hypothetical protein Bca101_083766 [Brassica carinata]
MISDLPRDVTEEVLSRLEVTSLGGVRSTCKKWNSLTKDDDFIKKHLGKNQKELQVVMLLEYKVYLMSVDLLTPPYIERIGKLVSLNHKDPAPAADGVEILTSFTATVVYCYASPKALSLLFGTLIVGRQGGSNPEILRTNFTGTLSDTRRRLIALFLGNTYWFAEEKLVGVAPGTEISDLRDFLLCFDFTKERFGRHLPLPFHSFGDIVTLSSVGEEKLAVLFQKQGLPPYTVKIWISSKIEPNAVLSWNNLFLTVDMNPLTGFLFLDNGGSFFVDEEEEEVAVVLDKARSKFCFTHNIACIIGKNGYFKQLDLGGGPNQIPLVSSYVPSSVDIM